MNKNELKKIRAVLPQNVALYAIVIFVLIFTLRSPGYLTLSNAINLFRQASVFCIITLASFLAILTHQTDLSVGSVASLTSVIIALLIKQGLPLTVAIIGGLCIGMLVH